MMKQHFLFFATCMMMGISACTHEEETAEVNTLSDHNVIRVTTGVASNVISTVSRAGYETSNLEEFGFFVNNPISDAFTYNNVKMVKEGGIWEPTAILSEMYWMSRLQPVTVLAYAPYQEGAYTVSSKITANVLPDQSTGKNVLASDMIGMKVDNFIPKVGEGGNLTEDGLVPVSMRHLMSKIRVSIEYPAKLNSVDNTNPVTDIKIDGVVLNGFCDFAAWNGGDDLSSVVTVDKETPNVETVIPFTDEFAQEADGGIATYECILIPQQVSLITIQFVVSGVPYSWKWEEVELKTGTMHKINLKIIGRKVELSTHVSVDDWEEDEITDNVDSE